MLGRKAKPITRIRRRSSAIKDVGISLALLLSIVSIAAVVTYVVTGPLIHPNLHPRLMKLGFYFVHYHPRLMKLITCLIIGLLPTLQLSALLAPIWWHYQSRKRGLLHKTGPKTFDLLDQSIKETYPVLLPQAWRNVKNSFPGLFVKVPDLRATHWELVEANENNRQLRLVMHYVHDPLHTKYWRVYPRRISCIVKVKGRGVRSEVEFTYHADSAMDYQTVAAIIRQTISQVKTAIEDDRPLSILAESGEILLPH
jgi:hypothetical protein